MISLLHVEKRLVVAAGIWMQLFGFAPIGGFNFFGARTEIDAENQIIVFRHTASTILCPLCPAVKIRAPKSFAIPRCDRSRRVGSSAYPRIATKRTWEFSLSSRRG